MKRSNVVMALVLYTQTDEQYLEEIERDPNYIDFEGSTSLCKAIFQFRDLTLVNKLLNNGANVNAFTIKSTLLARKTEIFEWRRLWGEFSALHIAIALGEIEIVRLLLANGADPNVLTTKGHHHCL